MVGQPTAEFTRQALQLVDTAERSLQEAQLRLESLKELPQLQIGLAFPIVDVS